MAPGVNLAGAMRDLGLSLVIVSVLGCGGRPAATAMGGDVPAYGTCSVDVTCSAGGGKGSLLVPVVVLGATAAGIAAIAYVYHLVRPGVRVTLSP